MHRALANVAALAAKYTQLVASSIPYSFGLSSSKQRVVITGKQGPEQAQNHMRMQQQ